MSLLDLLPWTLLGLTWIAIAIWFEERRKAADQRADDIAETDRAVGDCFPAVLMDKTYPPLWAPPPFSGDISDFCGDAGITAFHAREPATKGK